MKEVLSMAGHYAAHAVSSVSTGEILIPIVGYVDKQGKQSMVRLATGPAEAMSLGQEKMANISEDVQGAVFIKDALVELDSGKTDCLIVDVRFSQSDSRTMQFMIPYRNAANDAGFAVHRLKVTDFSGIEETEINSMAEDFFDGIESHSEGRQFWNDQYEEEAGESTTYHDDQPANAKLAGEDFEKLKAAPVLVFFLVAASDGKVDKKELTTFAKIIASADYVEDALFRRVISNVINDLPEIMTDFASNPRDYIADLKEIKEIVDSNFPPAEAQQFKVTLLAVGSKIAASSGGFFSKVSKDEKKMLAVIAVCLGLAEAS